MIKRFGNLYSGDVDLHVDRDDLGLEGLPVNERWLTDDHLATVFEKTQHIAQHLDRMGYDTFWMAEHHFQREGFECIPNLLLLNVHLANITENIRFGCGFNVTPMWHPLRMAEDFATANILTGGRIIFGVGRGYHTREVDSFGAPSTMTNNEANRELFEEQVEIIMKAFNNPSFSHQGKNYTIPPSVPYRGYELEEITLVPRPTKRPVETWQPLVSASQRAMDFMVKHGIKGVMGGGAGVGGANHDVVVRWRDAQASAGKEVELGSNLIIGYTVFLAETEEKAIDQVRPYYEEHMKVFGPLGFADLNEEQIEAMGDRRRAPSAGLPIVEDRIKLGQYICGPPELVTEKLMAIQEMYPGLEEVHINRPCGGLPEQLYLDQLEWFAKDVMPAFKGRDKATSAAD